MLKILIPTFMLIPLTWYSKKPWVWINPTSYSLLISMISLPLLYHNTDLGYNYNPSYTDSLSSPFVVLSCWPLPLMMIASQNHLMKKTYLTMLIILQLSLIMDLHHQN